ncbi:hypothetical protein [Oceanobacillus massiliensis]|uniref:hypothetical protein n=1 Tax=Oceanobacillus massiliensis TaxID=1465765 RepID=UPI000289312F|nr:hypothetical protein [Oceanobacillus massiliensis]
MIGAQGSRLQREKQQLKIPQEAVFASEEAEALPAESDCPERKSAVAVTSLFLSNTELEITTILTKRAK